LADLAGLPTGDPVLQVVLVGALHMRTLNRRYLGRDYATDVLAFDFRSVSPPLGREETIGEIYVCLDVAAANAARYNSSVGYEVVLYIVHGLLHLAGEDDGGAAACRSMRAAEKRIMDALVEKYPISTFF